MKKADIKVGGVYRAKVNGQVVDVRVDAVRGWGAPSVGYGTRYDVTNLRTGRKTTFRSAAKFRGESQSKVAMTKAVGDVPPGKVVVAVGGPEEDAGIENAIAGGNLDEAKRLLREDKTGRLLTDALGREGEQCSDPTPACPVAPSSGAQAAASTSTPTAGAASARTSSTPRSGLAARIAANQQAREASSTDSPHVECQALAGTGKTWTIMGGVLRMRGMGGDLPEPSPQQAEVWRAMAAGRGDSIRMSAFNTKITDVLKDRVTASGLDKTGVEARGIHSMGNGACFKAFGRQEPSQWAVIDRVAEAMNVNYRDAKRDPKLNGIIMATDELVGLCKQTLSEPTPENLDELSSHYDVELADRAQVYDLVPRVLDLCRTPNGRVHFDDMVWLPIVHELPIYKVDLQIVDESQDLNRMQQQLVYRAGHRVMFVGDRNQSIYGFAGADAESMDRLRTELGGTRRGCVTLPLTVTRRCSKAVVEEARRYVPEFAAHESNAVGSIRRARIERDHPQAYHGLVGDGDFVLCRTNAPLVSECFRFLKEGRKANILGRDIGRGLIKLIEKSKAASVPDLVGWLDDWLAKEMAQENAKKYPSEARLQAVEDRHSCLTHFCSGMSSVEDVRRKIESIFTDDKQLKGVTLSSIHKSKGLEARRVVFLKPRSGGFRRDKMQDWEHQQEANLEYVAITRAIEDLIYATEAPKSY